MLGFRLTGFTGRRGHKSNQINDATTKSATPTTDDASDPPIQPQPSSSTDQPEPELTTILQASGSSHPPDDQEPSLEGATALLSLEHQRATDLHADSLNNQPPPNNTALLLSGAGGMESVIRAWHNLPNTPSPGATTNYEPFPLTNNDNRSSSFHPFNSYSPTYVPGPNSSTRSPYLSRSGSTAQLSLDAELTSPPTKPQKPLPLEPFPGFPSGTWRTDIADAAAATASPPLTGYSSPTHPDLVDNHRPPTYIRDSLDELPAEYTMHDLTHHGYQPGQFVDLTPYGYPRQLSQHSLDNSSIGDTVPTMQHPILVRSRSTPFLGRPPQLGIHASANRSSLRLSMTMDDETDYMAAAEAAVQSGPAPPPPPLFMDPLPVNRHAHYSGSYSAPAKSPSSGHMVHGDLLGHVSSASIASSPDYNSRSRCLEPFPTLSASQISVGSSSHTSFYGTPPHLSPPTPFGVYAPMSIDEHACFSKGGPPLSPSYGLNSSVRSMYDQQPMWSYPNAGYSTLAHHRIPHAYHSPGGYYNGHVPHGLGATGPHHYSVDPFGLGSSGLRPRSFSATAALLGSYTNMPSIPSMPDSRTSRASSPNMGLLPMASTSATDLMRIHPDRSASFSSAHTPMPHPRHVQQVQNGPMAPILSSPSTTLNPSSDTVYGSVRDNSLGLRPLSTSVAGSSTGSFQDAQNSITMATMPPTLLPSLQALSGWAASRIHLYASKFGTPYPMYLSILGGEQVEFQFGFHVASNVSSSHGNKGGMSPTFTPVNMVGGAASGIPPSSASSPCMPILMPNAMSGTLPHGYFTQQHATQGHSVAFVLVEQVSLAARATELHVPTCTNAPNHLLSWTTVYAANSFGIYRLTPLQSHVLPLFVRPLVQYSERIINKEKMPHLALAVGEGGTGKTWSYLLGCIDYIVRGSHFQRGGLVSGSASAHHAPPHYYHQHQHGAGGQVPYGSSPMSLQEQHTLLLNASGPTQSNRVQHNAMIGLGPKAIILLPTKEAVMKMKKLLGDLAAAITNSWLKSQDILCPNHHQRPQRLVSYLAIVGNILKARLTMQLNDHDIVVATPSSLAELVENRNLRLDNVKYLIIDEITRVHEHASVQQLTNDVCSIVSHMPVSTKSHSIKIVLFSRHWNTNVQFLTERIAAMFQVAPPSSPQHSPGPVPSGQSTTSSSVAATGKSASVSSLVASSGGTANSDGYAAPTPCESYLKIVVCPKAFPHTIFPRPCLVPFAHHILRPLAHIPHHFVNIPSLSMRYEMLIRILQGKHHYEPPTLPATPSLPGDCTSSSNHVEHGPSLPTPLGSERCYPKCPRGVIVMTNTQQEASELHEQLCSSSVGPISFLVIPETLESTLNSVRAMGLPTRINAFHHRHKSGSSTNVSTTPPSTAPASPVLLCASPSAKASGMTRDVPSLDGGSSVSLHAASEEPLLVLVTMRPDAQTASWMLDLKAIAQDLSYTVVNYVCPVSIDDYVLSLLTHVSPHVSHGVDGALKMTLSSNRVPVRLLPQALVTLYSTDASCSPVSYSAAADIPPFEGSQDAISGPMQVGEYMPTTECDRVNLFRAVAGAISQSQGAV